MITPHSHFFLPALVAALAPLALGAQLAPAARLRHYETCRWHPECSTSGARLELRETGREPREAGTVVFYQVVAGDFPAGKRFELLLWGGEQAARITAGYFADSAGRLRCPSSPGRSPLARHPCISLDSLRIPVSSLYSGGPVRVAVVSLDDVVRIYSVSIPFPVFATDGRCRIDIEMVSRRRARVTGSGFAPGEVVVGVAQAGGVIATDTLAAGADGSVPGPRSQLIAPIDSVGTPGGRASYVLVGSSCRPSVEYLWGDRLSIK